MKRGGPLRRRQPLVVRKGMPRPAQWGLGAAAKLGAGAADRVLADEAALAWVRWAVRNGCEVCPVTGGRCYGKVEGHHPVERQWLRKRYRGLPEAELRAVLWDKRNALGVCAGAHQRHHRRAAPIPQHVLPQHVRAFAEEHGLLERLYKAHPVRVV